MRRRAARVDGNHADVVKALRKAGCLAYSTAPLGHGFPDVCVWSPYTKAIHLLEVKDGSKPPSARELTPDERAFADAGWPVVVVLNEVDALVAVGAVEGPKGAA